MKKEEFAVALKHLAVAFGKEFGEDETKVYYNYLKCYSLNVFKKAVNEAVKTQKFMPKISDLIEVCEKQKDFVRFEILETMKNNGYFKDASEYEKATMWLEKNIVPSWFKEDMKRYKRELLQNTVLIGGEL